MYETVFIVKQHSKRHSKYAKRREQLVDSNFHAHKATRHLSQEVILMTNKIRNAIMTSVIKVRIVKLVSKKNKKCKESMQQLL